MGSEKEDKVATISIYGGRFFLEARGREPDLNGTRISEERRGRQD